MATTTLDVAYDGTCITTHLGREEYPFQKITYEDGLDGVELLTHIGSQEASARTRGIYKPAVATISQLRAEWDRLVKRFPSNGFGNFRFPVTCTYNHPDLGKVTDRLLKCTIIGVKNDAEATGKATLVEMKIQPQQIVRNDRTINVRRNAPQRNTSGSSAAGVSVSSILSITFEL